MKVKGAILGILRQTFIVHILTLYQCLNAEANLIYRPSFISSWYGANAQNENLSLLVINHNLGEYPVKVDVQVKINQGGKDYIFSGLGSSQRDDDLSEDYGGVIYKYNDQHIELSFPYLKNNADTGGLAYTGSDNLYIGPTNLLGPYKDGYVRTRVWLASDMPHIVLNTSVYMSETTNYKEITHELGYYPDLVTVQTLLSNGYMSDGVGAVFMASTPSEHNSLSGVLYGYDESKIRLWVPSDFFNTRKNGGVFLADDGYKLGKFKSGDVKILAWNIQCSQQVYYKAFEVGDTIEHDDEINFPCIYDWTYFLVSVQYKVPDESSPNGGMVFNAAGTTQANELSNYGGVIYAYTENEVLLWRPTNGPVVYIGDRWGSGNSNQIAYTARVIIRVYHLREAECPYPETIGNATFNVTGVMYGDQTVYTCISGHSHVGGDISRICERNRQWSGIVPACIESKQKTKGSYEDIEEVLNNIRIKRKDTSAYKRSLISVNDERLSSKVIGITGVIIFTILIGIIVVPDLMTLFKHLCCPRSINK